jgi:ATP-dependent 26S proteasome regulatory subunit
MLDQLKLFIRSGYPVIAVETRDEETAVDTVRRAAGELHVTLYEWSVTTGLVRVVPSRAVTEITPGKPTGALEFALAKKGDGRQVFLFKDLGPHAKDPVVARLLRDVFGRDKVNLVLVEEDPLPPNVRRLAVSIPLPLPGPEELEQIVRETYREIRDSAYEEVTSTLTKRELEQIVQTLRGLTATEAARVIAVAVYQDYQLSADDLPRIVEAKRNLLQGTGCLESINVNFDVDEVGGLDNLKKWLVVRRGGMTAKARDFGLAAPRGILLLGVQGCGKSLCAKAVAADWGMPLLRMDPGVLYQKYIGETENRLREAMAQAEAMAPVVLWIDEIEKAFASASADSADGGLSQRMFGTLLSWMQDHKSPIFMVATANNIAALPPELMRKGRFDEVFFVDLPHAAARAQVLSIHLARRKRDPKGFNLGKLAAATDGFSGAELEQLVQSAMYAAFSDGADVTDAYLMGEVATTRPLSVLMGEKVAELRAWAEGRCVPAD